MNKTNEIRTEMFNHQDAIVSEKLELLKINSLKTEQKQAVVGVLNTDPWLSGSAVEILADFGFSPDVEEFDLRFQRCWVSQSSEVASSSAMTGFKLAFKNGLAQQRSKVLTHTSNRLWRNNLDWKRDQKSQIFR